MFVPVPHDVKPFSRPRGAVGRILLSYMRRVVLDTPMRSPINRRLSPPQVVLPPDADADAPAEHAAPSIDALHDDTPLPADLQFTPVVRRRRANPMTAVRQRAFIRALAVTGSVRDSLKAIGATKNSVYLLRDAPGGESFAAAWEKARARGRGRVVDVMYDHAVNGVPERIYKDGVLVAERRVFNTRAQMWIAQQHFADRSAVEPKRADDARAARTSEELRASMYAKLTAIRDGWLSELAQDPAKRAAWELIAGPVDWNDYSLHGVIKANDPSNFVPLTMVLAPQG